MAGILAITSCTAEQTVGTDESVWVSLRANASLQEEAKTTLSGTHTV